jgi:hypothetical protein
MTAPRVHVVPLNDTVVHHRSGRCCMAFFREEKGVMTHHPADKREQFERQGTVDPAKPWGVLFPDQLPL